MRQPFWAFVLAWALANSGVAAANACGLLADRFKALMGIGEGFDTRLRVERKSTNTAIQAREFRDAIAGLLRPEMGESLVLRDRPSSVDRVLVTSTNYPFHHAVQKQMGARIRVREYGERAKGSREHFQSTAQGDLVNLEVKARTELAGVVVKPILKAPKALLPKLFTDAATFSAERDTIISTLIALNDDAALVREVVDTIGRFHDVSLEMKRPLVADNIEYQRQAYVLRVRNDATGEMHNVQLTFDEAVAIRESVDPRQSPWEVSAQPPSHVYPSGEDAVVVIEMKSDLTIDAAYRDAASSGSFIAPTYWKVRALYERLQGAQAPGFEADRGKGGHIKKADTEE